MMYRHVNDTTQEEFVDLQDKVKVQEDELDTFRTCVDEIRDLFDFGWEIRVADIPRLARERMRLLVQERI